MTVNHGVLGSSPSGSAKIKEIHKYVSLFYYMSICNSTTSLCILNSYVLTVLIKTIANGQNSKIIDTKNLANGVYYVKIVSEGVLKTEEIIKK